MKNKITTEDILQKMAEQLGQLFDEVSRLRREIRHRDRTEDRYVVSSVNDIPVDVELLRHDKLVWWVGDRVDQGPRACFRTEQDARRAAQRWNMT